MKILKFIITWQFWVSVILAFAIFYGLLQGTFLWLSTYTNHGVQVEVPNITKLTLKDATTKLDADELKYEVDTSKYDPKFKPYQILEIYPLTGSNVKKGRTVFIRANAKTWKPVSLPNIIGKYKYLAFNQLNLVGLKVTDTIYEPNIAVNTILKVLYKGKEIQPGIILPRFSPLTLVLAKGLAKNVSVPSLIGLDEESAKNLINENLFSIGSIIYDNPDDQAGTKVYYQVPIPSSTYDQGQPIDLYLSSKSLDQLKEKIKNLDSTFNKKYISSDTLKHDSTADITPVDFPNSNHKIITDNSEPSEETFKPKKIIMED